MQLVGCGGVQHDGFNVIFNGAEVDVVSLLQRFGNAVVHQTFFGHVRHHVDREPCAVQPHHLFIAEEGTLQIDQRRTVRDLEIMINLGIRLGYT